MRAGNNELACEFANLLFAKKALVASASADNIVLSFEVHDRPFRGRNLITQFLDSILQPNTGTSCCLILCLELIRDIGIRNSVRYFSSTLGAICPKTDLDHITQSKTFNRQSVLKGADRFPEKF